MLICQIFSFVLLFLIALIIISAIKGRKKVKEEQKRTGLSIQALFQHINGLPIAENMMCLISSYPDRIEFKSGTTEIKLSRNKITDMCIQTDTKIQRQIVSSIGDALAGAAMFGTLGAIIGGRAKTKKIKTQTNYLIITYLGENEELKYIDFDTLKAFTSAMKLVNEFKKLNTTSGIHIDL